MSQHVDGVDDAVDDAVQLRVGVRDGDVEQGRRRAADVDQQQRGALPGGVVPLHVPGQRELVEVGGVAVDVSAQRIGLRISGPRARQVLAKGCAIDLHPRVFVPGSSAQTTLGQAGVVLLALGGRDDDAEFAVLVRSSFAGYLATWLLDACLEYADPAPTS